MINRKKRLILFLIINFSLIFAALSLVRIARCVSGTPIAKLTECPSRIFLGLYCPFCGGTRAMSELLRFNIISSLIYNPAILPSVISFGIYDIIALRAILKDREYVLHIHKWVWICIVALLILNWLVRNLLLIVWKIDYLAITTLS